MTREKSEIEFAEELESKSMNSPEATGNSVYSEKERQEHEQRIKELEEKLQENADRLLRGESENPHNPNIIRRPGLPSVLRDRGTRPAIGADTHQRTKRTQVGERKNLNFNGADYPGFHLHFVNDKPGRLEECQRNGYTFVTGNIKASADGKVGRPTQVGAKVERVVDSRSGEKGYLMKIPIQDWEKSLLERKEEADAAESGLTEGLGQMGVRNQDWYGAIGIQR